MVKNAHVGPPKNFQKIISDRILKNPLLKMINLGQNKHLHLFQLLHNELRLRPAASAIRTKPLRTLPAASKNH